MQNQNLPFNFKKVFELQNLGLNPELFKFGSVTFESQKYICVKDQAVSLLLRLIWSYFSSLYLLIASFKFNRIVPSLTRQKTLLSSVNP